MPPPLGSMLCMRLPGSGRDLLPPLSGHCCAIPCRAMINAELIWGHP